MNWLNTWFLSHEREQYGLHNIYQGIQTTEGSWRSYTVSQHNTMRNVLDSLKLHVNIQLNAYVTFLLLREQLSIRGSFYK